METKEEQRVRAYKKRRSESTDQLIKCLECPLSFTRVGSHVVQVHGYGNVSEYRLSHGLKSTDTSTPAHRQKMHDLNKSAANLVKGVDNRFKKGGDHGIAVSKYWASKRLNNKGEK